MIGLICRFVLQCMVTAPDVSAMGLDTSIVADLTAAVTFMQRTKGSSSMIYLSDEPLNTPLKDSRSPHKQPEIAIIESIMLLI